jgi:hypothetical protein
MTTIDDLTMTPKCAGSTGKCLPEAMEPWFPPKLCSLQLTKLVVESPWHHPCNQCATNVMISNLKPRIVKSTIDILVIISVYYLAKQKLGLGNPEQNLTRSHNGQIPMTVWHRMTYENGLRNNPCFDHCAISTVAASPCLQASLQCPEVRQTRSSRVTQSGDQNIAPSPESRVGSLKGPKPWRKSVGKILVSHSRWFHHVHQPEMWIPSSTRSELTEIQPLCRN